MSRYINYLNPRRDYEPGMSFKKILTNDSLLILFLVLMRGYEVVEYYHYLPAVLRKERYHLIEEDIYASPKLKVITLPNQGSCAPENWKIQSVGSIDTTKDHYLFDDKDYEQLLKYGANLDDFCYDSYHFRVLKTVPKKIDIFELIKKRVAPSE